jgi:hypothetical protein
LAAAQAMAKHTTMLSNSGGNAAQLFAAGDTRPFVGPALPRLVLRRFEFQPVQHMEAACA